MDNASQSIPSLHTVKAPATPLCPHPLHTSTYTSHHRREENLPVTKESCINELRTGRFYFHGHDKQGRPIAYYSLANHDPKNRDLAEIFRMMTYQIEKALENMSNDVTGFTIVWDTRNTGLKVRKSVCYGPRYLAG